MDQKQKIRKWCTIIILAAVFSVFLISSSWKNFRKGVYIGDQFFYKISDTLYRNGSSDDIKLQNSGGPDGRIRSRSCLRQGCLSKGSAVL